jgi:hypothetical protein
VLCISVTFSNIRTEIFDAHFCGRGLLACRPVSKMDHPVSDCLLLLRDLPCYGDVRPRYKWRYNIETDLTETGV